MKVVNENLILIFLSSSFLLLYYIPWKVTTSELIFTADRRHVYMIKTCLAVGLRHMLCIDQKLRCQSKTFPFKTRQLRTLIGALISCEVFC